MFRYKAAGDFLRALKTAAGDLVGAGPAERARVRGQLGRLVLRSRIDPDAGQPAGDTPPGSKGSAGAVPNEPPATPAAETPTATPPASPAAPPTASTVSPTYEQTLARIAAIKRSGRPSPSADTPVPFPPPPPPGPPSLPPTAGGVPVPAEPLPAMFQPPPAMPSPANPPSSTGSAPSPRKSRWYWPWRRPPQSS
jgi:hypothetical protein